MSALETATQLVPDENPLLAARPDRGTAGAALPTVAAAAAATLLTTVAMYAALRQGDWFARSVGAVLVVAGVGLAARALRLPGAGVVLAQLGASLGWVTALYAAEPATAGVLPLHRAAWAALGSAFDHGLVQLGSASPPVTPTPDMSIVVVAGVAVTALLVDAFAVTYGRPALAGLPLLTAYLVVAGGLPDGLDFWYFLLPATGYLVLLVVGGRARAAVMWPLILPSVLALAVALPAVTPDLPDGVLDRWTSSGGGSSRTISTLNPLVDLRRDLADRADFPLFTLRTDSSRPDELYLRTVTLDTFDGERWTFGRRQVESFDVDLPPPVLGPQVATAPVETTISIGDRLASDYLPLPYPTLTLDVPGSWRVDPNTGNVVSREGRRQLVDTTYTATSLELLPPTTGAAVGEWAPAGAAYTELPADLPPVVRGMAREVTRDAQTPLAAALALQAWFRDPNEFTYDLSARPGTGAPAIVDFLADRSGYCEQFAATMAVMARSLGIPARVNVGFTSGEPNSDGSRTVSSGDAHAWPELQLPGLGWTRFEPTPASASSGPAVPSWMGVEDPAGDDTIRPSQPQADPVQADPAPQPDDAAVTPETNRPACTGAEADPACRPDGSAPAPSAARDKGAGLGGRGILTAAAVALLLALTPAAGRAAIRRRRWSARAGEARVAEAAWRELRDSAVDLGYRWPTMRTPRQAADDLAAQAALSPEGEDALASVRATVERARYAAGPYGGQPSPAALRRTVAALRRELAAGVRRPARVRARMLPPSLLRGGSR